MTRNFAFLLAAGAVLSMGAPADRLMPMPAKMTVAQGRLAIDGNFHVSLTGYREPRLQAAAQGLIDRVSRQTGIPMLGRVTEDTNAPLVINCRRASEIVQKVGEDESYTLAVAPAQARLDAETPLGVLRGIETFLQLVEPDAQGWAIVAVRIDDKPRFPWRGLLIDVARHYMPLDALRRNIDAMAAVKMNVLHLHLSDNQGFRVESKVFPELQEKGSDGLYYTQDQLRGLVEYARERGIRVIPEFDMPGHTTSFFVSHPEIASAPGPYQLDRTWGVLDPCMDPTKEETYTLLDKFIGEMASLFPDTYFHIGGDEVNGKQWNANPQIQAFKRDHGMKNNHDLQVYFNQRLQKIVSKYGKIVVGWDEVLHPDLPKNIVVQSWRGQESLAQAARQGYMGILSNGYYLDLWYPASEHYKVDPMAKGAATLTPEEQARILGGEACMWSEFTNGERLDMAVWPRNAAIAERLWSPQSVTGVQSMYRRLEVTSRWLDWLGLTHRSSYPMMLERLAGNHPAAELRILADAVEPVKGYQRNATRKYTSFSPLNRLVDAARPESAPAREFASMVDQVIAGNAPNGTASQLRQIMIAWRDNHARLLPAMQESFLLQEAIPISQDLANLGAAGLRALDAIASGKASDQAWVSQQVAMAKAAAKPRAELLLVVAPSVQRLIEASARVR